MKRALLFLSFLFTSGLVVSAQELRTITPLGPQPNAVGEAIIEGNVARFISGDSKKCKITLTFLTNRIEVTQEGSAADCGYRHNLVATGTYRRIKGGHARLVRLR